MGERIRIARLRKGMTKVELAEKTGISRISIAKIENGETENMSVNTAIAIARVLEMSLDFLLCGK